MSATPKKSGFKIGAREFVPGNPAGHDTKFYGLLIKTPPKGNDINPEVQHRNRLKAHLKAKAEADLEEIYFLDIVTLTKLMKKSMDENDHKTGRIVSKAMQDMQRKFY
jgi:hypothetical protein